MRCHPVGISTICSFSAAHARQTLPYVVREDHNYSVWTERKKKYVDIMKTLEERDGPRYSTSTSTKIELLKSGLSVSQSVGLKLLLPW